MALIGALVFFGILILASVSASFSLRQEGNPYAFLQHQALFGLLPGLAAGYVLWRMDLSLVRKWSGAVMAGCVALLFLILLPGVGANYGGATRWISLFGISFQPSEALKFGFIVYAAALLASRRSAKREREALLPFAGVMALLGALLIAQPDASTLAVLLFIGFAMYVAAETPLSHILLLGGGGAALFGILLVTARYRLDRLFVFLNPMLDPMGKGFQAKQALIGIGSGGMTGVGLGLSFQKFGVLPEPISDSIFAVFAEEMGFVGAAFLIVLFLAFAWRGCALAARAADPFARLLAVGVVSWISVQAFVNMGAMIGLLPLTGIPLPLIGYGGSALAAELAGLGLLLNATASVGGRGGA